MKRQSWAILFVGHDGSQEYLHSGMSDDVAIFRTWDEAAEKRDFIAAGVAGDFQSINIVRYGK